MATKKCEGACKPPVKEEVRVKRVSVRDKTRAKRAALRGVAVLTVLCLSAFVMGCASATPQSKGQTNSSKGNAVTVNVVLGSGTNCVVGNVNVSVSDAIGTQVQSADAGRDDATMQTAVPTNTSGVTGDKPIETVGEVGAAALTSGGSTAAKVITDKVKALAGSDAPAVVTEAAAATCASGSCAPPK